MIKMQGHNLSFVLCLLIAVGVMGPAWCDLQGDLIATFPDAALRKMVPFNGGLWLAVAAGYEGAQIWFSDLTPAGTTMLKEFMDLQWAWLLDAPPTLTIGNTVYFTAVAPEEGPSSFWNGFGRSDGTPDGTVLIQQTGSSIISLLGEVNGAALFYTAYDIWRSDGTESGTYVIKTGVDAYEKTVMLDGVMYFGGHTPEYGAELWRTDGTESGTYMVEDLNPGPEDGCWPRFFVMNGVLYFEGQDGTTGSGVARTDGTPEGTFLVRVIFPYTYWHCGIAYVTPLGNTTLFWAYDGSENHGYELWKSNGTTAGTSLVKDINPGPADSPSSVAPMVVLGGTAYFFADDGVHGNELWKSDGTTAGTSLVVDFPGGGGGLHGPVDGKTYFTRYVSYPHDPGLYQSDGTAEGTVLVDALEEGGQVDDLWSQDGVTYLGWKAPGGLIYIYELGRVSESGIEWIELRDVEQGVSDTASSVTRPYTLGSTTYFCGTHGGLWAVNNSFQFVKTPYGAWKTVGDPLELSVECAGGIGTLSYQWYKDGAPIDDATEAMFVIESLTADDGGLYTCRVTDTAKTIYETEPALIEVFEEGELPAAGPVAIIAMAAGCAAWGVRRLLRKRQGT